MENITLLLGDCLERMAEIPDGSVDMICCDPPYQTTACRWDTIIPFEPMWAAVKRVLKKNGAAVFTASQPFTSALVMSNADAFRHEWIWEKSKASNFLLARKQPLKAHESALTFCFGTPPYYPQKTAGKPYSGEKRAGRKGSNSEVVNDVPNPQFRTGSADGTRFPRSVQYFATPESEGATFHPTQKPVALCEYLIRTYTNEGETVLDFTMGSGTCGVAAVNTGRKFLGIERDPTYFEIAQSRIQAATPKPVVASAAPVIEPAKEAEPLPLEHLWL